MSGARFRELRAEGFVHGNRAERGRVGVAIVDGGKGEIIIVRGRNHHDARVLPLLQQCIGIGGHRARVDVARVRRNQRHERLLKVRHGGVRQEAIDHLREFFGVAGVEGSGDGGRANFLPVAPADPARDHGQHGQQREKP